jgi:aspartokinase-like uncharacterized kinase
VTIDAVVKVGGSLIRGASLRPLLDTLGDLGQAHGLVIVPGGGPGADAVREMDRLHAAGDTAAHWMAVLAMDQNAHLLAGLMRSADRVVDAGGVRRAIAAGRVAILAPYSWLHDTDPLPHRWDVTSDSIAAWAAAELHSPRLVLLKALDGAADGAGNVLADVSSSVLSSTGIVDAYFPEALAPATECWVLNGRHPDRLEALFRNGPVLGTRVR